MGRLMGRVGRLMRDRRGMTLLEMVAAIFILAILSLTLAGLSPYIASVYAENLTLSHAKYVSATALDFLSHELRYGSDIRVDASSYIVYLDSQTYGADCAIELKRRDDSVRNDYGRLAVLTADQLAQPEERRIYRYPYDEKTYSGLWVRFSVQETSPGSHCYHLQVDVVNDAGENVQTAQAVVETLVP